jgi:uncharacterized protein (TIGR03086 family)
MSVGLRDRLYYESAREAATTRRSFAMPTNMIDLRPAARAVAELVRSVGDDKLTAATPCPAYTLGDLLDHVGGLSIAFTAAARKDVLPEAERGPSADASRLGEDWRTRIPTALEQLAEAWQDPDAWTGMTQAGPVELPGDVAGLVALNEVVVHGWDVAVASGQRYDIDEKAIDGAQRFVAQFSGPGQDEARQGLFGPEIEVPVTAPKLDRLLGMAGRDPHWAPPTTSDG